MKISFVLNGEKVECDVDENERLVTTLRERFSIKSVKEGCGIGECGTCTVLIDDKPFYSCLTLSSKIDGHDVKTVEFLNRGNTLHPLQEAFIKEGAIQCGYCTPGMILSAYGLLLENKKSLDIQKIKEGISGNLCRCTGYHQIIEAIKSCLKLETNEYIKNVEKVTKKQKISLADLKKALHENKGLKPIAGGTDILVIARKKGEKFKFISLTETDELKNIKEENGTIVIGATVTHREIKENSIINEKARSLAMACGVVGSPQIRNMGTIGGNIVNASPAADSIPPLLVHDAICVLESFHTNREIPLSEFIVAPYKTSIKENEILTCIKIKGLNDYREGYEKVAKRAALAISRLSIAYAIKENDGYFEDVRISIGSCTPIPFRPKEAEQFLKGKRKEDAVITEAIKMITKGIVDTSGMRPSYRYKLPVIEGLLFKIFRG